VDEFDTWNKLKKKIDSRNISPDFVPKKNEVWMCMLGKNIGYEQNGRGSRFLQPVLLLRKFRGYKNLGRYYYIGDKRQTN